MQQFALTHFDDFLAIARQQAVRERLIFVFAHKELPEEHTEEQARQFEAGDGGHLAPLACVDKSAEELTGFGQLAAEARRLLDHWDAVFAAALPAPDENRTAIDEAIQTMLHNIREGFAANYLVFDREGHPLHLSTAPSA